MPAVTSWTVWPFNNSQTYKLIAMNLFVNRIVTAFRAMTVERIMFIEISYDQKKKQDKVTLWTTETDLHQQAFLLRQLANSLEHDAQQEDLKKSRTFKPQSE